MTTPKEFRDAHNLSEAQFKRLTKKVGELHPHLVPFTERVQGREFKVNHEQILEAHLESMKTDTSFVAAQTYPHKLEKSGLMGKLAKLSVQVSDTANTNAMASLARIESPTPNLALPRTADIATVNAELVEQQSEIETLDVVLDTTLQKLKALADIQKAQQQEKKLKTRKQELQAAMLDELAKVMQEKQAREHVRNALENGADISDILAQAIDTITDAME